MAGAHRRGTSQARMGEQTISRPTTSSRARLFWIKVPPQAGHCGERLEESTLREVGGTVRKREKNGTGGSRFGRKALVLCDRSEETVDRLTERLGIEKQGDDPAGEIGGVAFGAEERREPVPPGDAVGGHAGLLEEPIRHGGIVGPGADGGEHLGLVQAKVTEEIAVDAAAFAEGYAVGKGQLAAEEDAGLGHMPGEPATAGKLGEGVGELHGIGVAGKLPRRCRHDDCQISAGIEMARGV